MSGGIRASFRKAVTFIPARPRGQSGFIRVGLTMPSKLMGPHQQTLAGEDVRGVFVGVWAEDGTEFQARQAGLAKINNR